MNHHFFHHFTTSTATTSTATTTTTTSTNTIATTNGNGSNAASRTPAKLYNVTFDMNPHDNNMSSNFHDHSLASSSTSSSSTSTSTSTTNCQRNSRSPSQQGGGEQGQQGIQLPSSSSDHINGAIATHYQSASSNQSQQQQQQQQVGRLREELQPADTAAATMLVHDYQSQHQQQTEDVRYNFHSGEGGYSPLDDTTSTIHRNFYMNYHPSNDQPQHLLDQDQEQALYHPYSLADITIANLGNFLPIPPPPTNAQSCSSQDNDLLTLVQSYEWSAALERISTHPSEATSVGEQGRTPLHVACDHDAPAFVIKALLQANPEVATMVGTSDMNPLHITCSSQHASVEVVRVLLDGCLDACKITAMKDVDGDTSLHVACRCGAPIEVLEVLLRANPQVVHDRDYEGLTPLLRLWVRYFVMLGDDMINSVSHKDDVKGDLVEAWDKTELLLRAAYYGSLVVDDENDDDVSYTPNTCNNQTVANPCGRSDQPNPLYDTKLHVIAGGPLRQQAEMKKKPVVHPYESKSANSSIQSGIDLQQEFHAASQPSPFYVLHAASRVDCPRAVVKIASVLYPEQLHEYDSTMCTPLMIAAAAPVFKEHDLSGEGYSMGEEDDDGLGDDDDSRVNAPRRFHEDSVAEQKQPTVIQILLEAGAKANHGNPHLKQGRLPLHSAIVSGKRWNEGLKCLRNAYPDSLMVIDKETGLYPFMLAAAVGGDALKEEITTAGRSADLNTIFEILRSGPDQCDIVDD